MATWVILGCGYTGTRLARALLAEGHEVRAAARNLDRLAPLAELGAQLYQIDGAKRRSLGPVLYGAREARVVFSIPPVQGMPPGLTIASAAEAAQAASVRSFVYLGSTAVYGETPSGDIVDEDSSISIGDSAAAPRIGEEIAVDTARLSGLRTVILRLAAIYGPGRGVRERLKLGNYQLLDDGIHYYSRIHVDDLCGVIRAAAEHEVSGRTYCVADDRPSTQREYLEWLSARMQLPMPPSVASLAPGARRRPVRNRKISNARMKAELGYRLRYPSFVEGELAIEAEIGSASQVPAPAPAPVAAPTPVVAAAAPSSPDAAFDLKAAVDALVDQLEAASARANPDELDATKAALHPLRQAIAKLDGDAKT